MPCGMTCLHICNTREGRHRKEFYNFIIYQSVSTSILFPQLTILGETNEKSKTVHCEKLDNIDGGKGGK